MTCATCQHYRPARGRFGRCALAGEHVRHDHHCDDHADAERETIEDWLAKHGSPERHPVEHDWTFAKKSRSMMSRRERAEQQRQRTDQGYTWLT